MKRLATAFGFVAFAGLAVSQARADSTATIQDNGLTCRNASGHEFGVWARNYSGIKNVGTQTFRLYCPLSAPSYDSDKLKNPNISDLRIFFTGAAPTCWQYVLTRTGSVFSSANGTEDILLFPHRIVFSSGLSSSGATIGSVGLSIGYACNVPVGTTINGSAFSSNVGPVVGGL
jgi:hypothetical protein